MIGTCWILARYSRKKQRERKRQRRIFNQDN
jgi:hypothetical protein